MHVTRRVRHHRQHHEEVQPELELAVDEAARHKELEDEAIRLALEDEAAQKAKNEAMDNAVRHKQLEEEAIRLALEDEAAQVAKDKALADAVAEGSQLHISNSDNSLESFESCAPEMEVWVVFHAL